MAYHNKGNEEENGREDQGGDGERRKEVLVVAMGLMVAMSLVGVDASADEVARDGIHDCHGDVSRVRSVVKFVEIEGLTVEVEKKQRKRENE